MNNGKLPPHQATPPPLSSSLVVRPPASISSLENSPHYSSQPDADANNNEAVHLREYLRIIKRRKYLVWVTVLLGTMLGILYSFHIKSSYTAKVMIEIGTEAPTLMKGGEAVYYMNDYEVKTAVQILQSRPLQTEISKAMKLGENKNFLDVTEERSLGETFAAVFDKAPAPMSDRKVLAGIFADNPDEVKPIINPNEQVLSEKEQEKMRLLLGAIQSNLKVSTIRDSRLVNIEYSHTDPVLAAAIANTLAKTFIDSNFRSKTNKYTKTSDWLDRTTRSLKAKVEQSEQELGDYTKANNIFSIDNKSTLTTEKLAKLHEQTMRAEADRILKNSLYQEVIQGRVEQLPEAFSDPKTIELKKKLGELSTQVAQLEVKFGARNPKVVEIRQQMTAIELQLKASSSTLEERLKADYERAVRDEKSLKEALVKAKSEAVQENQAAIQFGLLRQNVETTKALYNDFLQKTTQAQAQVAEQYNNIKLIEPAEVPPSAARPKRLQNILLAFLLSTVAGIGLALFFDYLDNTIKDSHDITHYSGLPTLAIVPKLINKENLATQNQMSGENPYQKKASLLALEEKNKSSLLALNTQLHDAMLNLPGIEAYRTLRTSILLSTAGGAPKKILFTSGLPGEGKSTTVINTALSLARLGRSVILIDADMRRPSVHKYFGLSHNIGLSNYLSGEVSLEKAVHPTGVSNLFLLPSGIIPPNAAELVSSENMRQLLAELAQTYDHILIDTPPLLHVTDGLVLSTMADGVILLVNSGKCTRDVLRSCRSQLAKVNAKVLGAVLNNFSFEKEGYGYYDYRQYGTYGAENTTPAQEHVS